MVEYRERVAWSGVALALFFGSVILVLILVGRQPSGSRAAGLAAAGVVAAIVAAVTAAFGVLRISVDDERLAVGFPVYRRRVPLDEVVACRPIRYRWWQYGGYGVRLGRGGMMLNVAGDGGRAVEVTRRSGGALRFSSRDPVAVCAAIRARRPAVAGD